MSNKNFLSNYFHYRHNLLRIADVKASRSNSRFDYAPMSASYLETSCKIYRLRNYFAVIISYVFSQGSFITVILLNLMVVKLVERLLFSRAQCHEISLFYYTINRIIG